MESRTIRSTYLEFFRERGHAIVPGSSLVPFDDPTLLFTSAGMVQFKKLWATDSPPPYVRAATCQKCVRAGGKDSDLEKIGSSARHHSFFEMLGNFSFGDYFKEEAIGFAWEFATGRLRLDPQRILVSYYRDDPETRGIWERLVDPSRLVPLGEKDNFWGPAGETGACGPCTELYYDFGPALSCGRPGCAPGCDCARYVEFWNLVFPQFDKQADGSMPPLKRRGVDTGMGLERIARILQGTPSNYETDLFMPVIRAVEGMSGRSYEDDAARPAFRVIADHARAAVFLLDDNVLPSNEGRGYVLRRIIRRACFFGLRLDLREPFLHRLVAAATSAMAEAYPSLAAHAVFIERVLHEEEEKFHAVIESAGRLFGDLARDYGRGTVPGAALFKLYDTHGIPRDLIDEMGIERSMRMDWEGFDALLAGQKRRSREASSFAGAAEEIAGGAAGETVFLGYETLAASAVLRSVSREAGSEDLRLVLDRTPFYPEKGGQVGDRGSISGDGFAFAVSDTQVDEKGVILHVGRTSDGSLPPVGSTLAAAVDPAFRKRVAANHTATHLLHYALRSVLGPEVRQAGSRVDAERLRFDFVCFAEVDDAALRAVESLVQERIFDDAPVTTRETGLDDAVAAGAVALFVNRYGERVRVVSSGDFHSEVCGGTHAARTGEIALFKILSFSTVGRNLKRIEALTGRAALERLASFEETGKRLSALLAVPPERLGAKVERLLADLKDATAALRRREAGRAGDLAGELAAAAAPITVAGAPARLASGRADIGDPAGAGALADEVMRKIGRGVVVLAFETKGRFAIVVKVSDDIAPRRGAGALMKCIAPVIGGGGGGNPSFAQGTGGKPEAFPDAVARIREILEAP